MEGKIGCCRVTLADDVCIPPSCEVVAKCNVLPPIFDKVPELGLIEPSCRFMESDRALVARALVTGKKFAPVRMLNLSDQVLNVYKGTLVANLVPVENVEDLKDDKCFDDKQQSMPDRSCLSFVSYNDQIVAIGCLGLNESSSSE